jgi:tRNA threonylcarbamoyladenosine dehydratase
MAQTQLTESYLQRFSGVGRLYGQDAMLALDNAHFVVAGIGGVGTWVAEALARSGIGELTLIDLDDVCITNTNRQTHALQSTIGHSKVAVMAARLRDINPEIIVHEVEDFVDKENVCDLIKEHHHVVIDATDSAYAKAAIIARTRRLKRQIITVGSAGGKRDPRCITSLDLSRTTKDPLLAKVRNQLRRSYDYPKNPKRTFRVEAVYSTEQMVYPTDDGGVCHARVDMSDGTKLDCSGGFGASTMITSTFGTVATARAIERYLERVQSQ